MSDTHDDMPTEEEMAYLKEEVERSQFWSAFLREFEKSPMEALEDYQKTMQSMDDEKRKEKGLEPRPWGEIAMELEEESNRVFEHLGDFEEDVRKSDAEQRKAQGLEPRSDEELEAELGLGLGHQIQEVVMKYDDQKRKEKGLQPRSWREFMEEFEEAVESLKEDGNDGVSALTKMASLSFGNASGLK